MRTVFGDNCSDVIFLCVYVCVIFRRVCRGGSLETTAVMQYLCVCDLQESVSVTKVSLEMIAVRT